MKAYLVDPMKRTVTSFDHEPDDTFRQYLPGGLTVCWIFANGDVLYVDDEFLLRKPQVAFRAKERPDLQPMMSNGVLTGPDRYGKTTEPRMTPEQLLEQIEWLTMAQAVQWFQDNAGEPAITVTSLDDAPEVQVLATWQNFLEGIERDMKDMDGEGDDK